MTDYLSQSTLEINQVITEFYFYTKCIPNLMMKIYGRMISMDLSYTHLVPLQSCSALTAYFGNFNFSVNQQVGDKTGRILILDINIDEIRYVLINIYNANTKVGQVPLL